MASLLPIVIFLTNLFIPLMVATFTWKLVQPESLVGVAATLALDFVLFIITYVLTAATLSLPFQKAIIPGTFPRVLTNKLYFARRVFGTCWTSIYYFQALYFIVLSIPFTKKALFRLFGYKGNVDFTIYPDAWIRDIPLLSFRSGSYIANRSTLGTNVCLQDGNILVGPVRIGERSVLGHLAIFGLGSTLGDGSEVGVGVAGGVKVKIGKKTQIAAIAGLNHGCQIGSNCEVGAQSYVGLKAIVRDNIVVPAGCIIPNGAVVESQEQVDDFVSSESYSLMKHRHAIAKLVASISVVPDLDSART